MSQCTDPRFSDRLYPYELGLLSEEEHQAMELHILDCEVCSIAVREFMPTVDLLRHNLEVRKLVESLDPGNERSEELTPPVRKSRPRFFKWAPLAIAAGILFLLIAKDWQFEIKPSQEAMADFGWTSSVAVLPFTNLSEDQDQKHLSRGIAEAINDKLAQVRNIKVISLSSTMQYLDSSASPQTLARELGVAHIVEGSLILDDTLLRVSARLIKAADGQLLWSNQYDVNFKSILDMQDELSFAIANALQIKLAPQFLEGFGNSHRPPSEAYDYYLRGTQYVNNMYQPWGKLDYLKLGIEMFQKAIALDSQYVDAYVGAAWGYANLNSRQHRPEQDSLTWWYCQKAWNLDSTLWSSTFAMGAYLWHAQRYDEAYKKLALAFEANPNSFELNRFMGDFYRGFGLYDKALMHYRRAVQLSPTQVGSRGMIGEILFATGQVTESAKIHEKILEMQPGLIVYQALYCRDLIAMGKIDQAQKIVDDHYRWHDKTTPDKRVNIQMQMARALLFAAKGDRKDALKIFDSLPNIRRLQYVYSLLGMNQEAVNYIANRVDSLERQDEYRQYESDLLYLSLIHHPFLKGLQDNPEFEQLVERQRKLHIEFLRRFGRPSS